jgi:hypothetical protein
VDAFVKQSIQSMKSIRSSQGKMSVTQKDELLAKQSLDEGNGPAEPDSTTKLQQKTIKLQSAQKPTITDGVKNTTSQKRAKINPSLLSPKMHLSTQTQVARAENQLKHSRIVSEQI